MSFILEALKKSEHSHHNGKVPTLDTRHHDTETVPHKRQLWQKALTSLLILNALLLIWLFYSWQHADKHDIAQSTTLPTIEEKALGNAAVTSSTTQLAHLENSKPNNRDHHSSAQATTIATHKISPAKQPLITISTNQSCQQTNSPITHQLPPSRAPILTLEQLPPEIQQQFSGLHMSVHAYSGNGNSLIRLNNKIMRTGSTLNGGFHLEQITADGAILEYMGYRCKILRKGE